MDKVIKSIPIIVGLLTLCFATKSIAEHPLQPKWETEIVLPLLDKESDVLYNTLADENLVWYKLPKVYQSNGRVYNVDVLPELNANKDFPWIGTAGLEENDSYSVIDFINTHGEPVVICDTERPVKWIFPPKTEVGEMIMVKYENLKYVLEVRVREKSIDNGIWNVKIYSRFKNEKHLEHILKKIHPESLNNWNKTKKFFFFRNPEEEEVMILGGLIPKIPNFNPLIVKRLLEEPLMDVTGEVWRDDEVEVPSSDILFNIVPKNYSRGLINAEEESCARCHNQTGISTTKLTPNETIIKMNHHRAGRIRGYDGIHLEIAPFATKKTKRNPLPIEHMRQIGS